MHRAYPHPTCAALLSSRGSLREGSVRERTMLDAAQNTHQLQPEKVYSRLQAKEAVPDGGGGPFALPRCRHTPDSTHGRHRHPGARSELHPYLCVGCTEHGPVAQNSSESACPLHLRHPLWLSRLRHSLWLSRLYTVTYARVRSYDLPSSYARPSRLALPVSCDQRAPLVNYARPSRLALPVSHACAREALPSSSALAYI